MSTDQETKKPTKRCIKITTVANLDHHLVIDQISDFYDRPITVRNPDRTTSQIPGVHFDFQDSTWTGIDATNEQAKAIKARIKEIDPTQRYLKATLLGEGNRCHFVRVADITRVEDRHPVTEEVDGKMVTTHSCLVHFADDWNSIYLAEKATTVVRQIERLRDQMEQDCELCKCEPEDEEKDPPPPLGPRSEGDTA